MSTRTKAAISLTDGTGVSPITLAKLVKDLVADFLLSAAAALAAAQIVDFGSAVNSPNVVAFALMGAFIRSAYRIVLRWAQS